MGLNISPLPALSVWEGVAYPGWVCPAAYFPAYLGPSLYSVLSSPKFIFLGRERAAAPSLLMHRELEGVVGPDLSDWSHGQGQADLKVGRGDIQRGGQGKDECQEGPGSLGSAVPGERWDEGHNFAIFRVCPWGPRQQGGIHRNFLR